MKKLTPCLIVFLVLPTSPLLSWGTTGHRVVGQIAQNHLTVKASAALQEIMGYESLAQASTWADEIRSDPAWAHAAPWHYISIDAGEVFSSPEFQSRRAAGGDVIEAIGRFTEVLKDPTESRRRKQNAVRFLVHFIGDMHQPLHVGRRDDRGGNDVRVNWRRSPTNLHSVWDSAMINMRNLSYSEFVAFLDHATPSEIREAQSSELTDWMEESKALQIRLYEESNHFQSEQDRDLGYAYSYKNMPRVEDRLLKAGLRLAGLLNSALDW